MNRALLGWGLTALVFYLLFLLLTLPAQRVAAWSGAPLRDARGTLWSGEASLQVAGESIQPLRWHAHPLWPWQGVLGARIEAAHQGWQAEGALRLEWMGGVQVIGATLSGPLDAPLLARHIPLPLAGQARLHIPRALWHKGLEEAEEVRLEVFEPRLMLGEPIALGTLAAEFEVHEGRLDGTLRDMGGPLELSGRLAGDARSGIRLDAHLKARPGAPAALREQIELLPAAPEGGARLQTRLIAPWRT